MDDNNIDQTTLLKVREYEVCHIQVIEYVDELRAFLLHSDLEYIMDEHPVLLPLYLAALKAVC